MFCQFYWWNSSFRFPRSEVILQNVNEVNRALPRFTAASSLWRRNVVLYSGIKKLTSVQLSRSIFWVLTKLTDPRSENRSLSHVFRCSQWPVPSEYQTGNWKLLVECKQLVHFPVWCLCTRPIGLGILVHRSVVIGCCSSVAVVAKIPRSIRQVH